MIFDLIMFGQMTILINALTEFQNMSLYREVFVFIPEILELAQNSVIGLYNSLTMFQEAGDSSRKDVEW